MRLSTRFGIGAALAVLPLVLVIASSLDQMGRIAEASERISTRQLAVARLNANVVGRLDRLREYERKFALSGDDGYQRLFGETVAAISSEIPRVSAARSEPDDTEDPLSALSIAWDDFEQRWAQRIAQADHDGLHGALDEIEALGLQAQTMSVREAEEQAHAATRRRQETRRTALSVAATALLASLGLVLWAVQTLRKRLDHFIEGTVAVSRGAFSFQLDERPRDELGRAARAFNHMVRTLGQLERMKADFISSVSHELRTPLVAMTETNRALLDEVSGPLTPSQARMLQLNNRAVARLSNMIGDLLELSSLKAKMRYEIAKTDLRRLSAQALEEFDAWANEHAITLSLHAPPRAIPAWVDPNRYVQVVQNLVENGLKYSPEGGTVTVRLRRASRAQLPACHVPGARFVWLSVDDSGPGIPPQERARVFDKFFRRSGHSSDGGVGLGLAICREIVAAHGGQIWIDDSSAGGASLNAVFPEEMSVLDSEVTTS